jgi:hypothetical protein
MRDDDPAVLDSLVGPELNVGSPQSTLAEPLLAALRELLATDTDYVARVKAHWPVGNGTRKRRGGGGETHGASDPCRACPERGPHVAEGTVPDTEGREARFTCRGLVSARPGGDTTSYASPALVETARAKQLLARRRRRGR